MKKIKGPKPWSRQRILGHMQSKGYVLTKDGQLEHRVVCREAHGPFPKDWVVHHIDSVNDNNHPLNLIALPAKLHNTLHTLQAKQKVQFTRQQIDAMLKSYVNLAKGKPLAIVINITVSQNQMVTSVPEVTATIQRTGSSLYR